MMLSDGHWVYFCSDYPPPKEEELGIILVCLSIRLLDAIPQKWLVGISSI